MATNMTPETLIPTEDLGGATELSQNQQVHARVREHSFIMDEQVKGGGDNLGPNPNEVAMTALGACTTMVAKLMAEKHGITMTSIGSDVVGTLDLRGVTFREPVAQPYHKVTITYRVTGKVSADEVALMQAAIHDFSPLYAVFKQSGAQLIESWEITPGA